jgi:uncharacterized glyoxalase superfamily protein PhnB
MITQQEIDALVGISKPPSVLIEGGGEDDKKKKKSAEPFDMGAEMKSLYNKPLKYDNNRTSAELVKAAAQRAGIDPSFLYASAYQEGMNQAIAKPDDVSEAYLNAKVSSKDFPVDGFLDYGLDTFGTKFPDLVKKGYLPQDFKYHPYPAENEKKEKVTTAAFRNNEDAILAKAAFLKDGMDNIDGYAKKLGVSLDDKARQYFTLAAFNGGIGNAQIMMKEYAAAKDKKAFIEKGLTSRGGVHKNIAPRLKNMQVASEFFVDKTEPPIPSPSQIISK